jgi:hypothetical protein
MNAVEIEAAVSTLASQPFDLLVRILHSLLHAGLARRTNIAISQATEPGVSFRCNLRNGLLSEAVLMQARKPPRNRLQKGFFCMNPTMQTNNFDMLASAFPVVTSRGGSSH